MKPSVIICVGNSGSGKSTWSQDFIKKNPGYLVISKDSIRKGLLNISGDLYWKRSDVSVLEGVVHKIYQESIKSCLSRGYSVVLDGTHIHPSAIPSLTPFLDSLAYPTLYKFKIFNCKTSICKQRVFQRDGEVSLEFIDRFEPLFKATKRFLRENYPKLILRNVGRYK